MISCTYFYHIFHGPINFEAMASNILPDVEAFTKKRDSEKMKSKGEKTDSTFRRVKNVNCAVLLFFVGM